MCVPPYSCRTELASGTLQRACPKEILPPLTLYALTPPHKGITLSARHLIEQMRRSLASKAREGVRLPT